VLFRGWIWFRFQLAAHRTQATWSFALLATISAGIAIARGVGWPDASFWASKTGAALVVVSASAALLGNYLVVSAYITRVRRGRSQADLEAGARTIHDELRKLPEMTEADIGVHIFTLRGPRGLRHLHPRAICAPSRRRSPGDSRNVSRRGKGAIGSLWKFGGNVNEAFLYVDVGRLPQNRADFEKLESSARWGLTWKDYQDVKSSSAIIAEPLYADPQGSGRSSGRFCGAISIDLRGTKPSPDSLRDVWAHQRLAGPIYVALTSCETAIARETDLG
jgi:hypothetical protein